MTTFIYALKEPDTGEIRYIGKSGDPKDRLRGHIKDSKRESTHKANWIRRLLKAESAPVLEILDEVSMDEWKSWEVAYIEFFREQGNDLTNHTIGGEDPPSHRGMKRTPETCKKLSEALRGKRGTMLGKCFSKEHRERISAANTGKKQSVETRKKLSEIRLKQKCPRTGSKHSVEARRKLSEARKLRVITIETRQKTSRTHLKINSRKAWDALGWIFV